MSSTIKHVRTQINLSFYVVGNFFKVAYIYLYIATKNAMAIEIKFPFICIHEKQVQCLCSAKYLGSLFKCRHAEQHIFMDVLSSCISSSISYRWRRPRRFNKI